MSERWTISDSLGSTVIAFTKILDFSAADSLQRVTVRIEYWAKSENSGLKWKFKNLLKVT
jgi:hypothetical protein